MPRVSKVDACMFCGEAPCVCNVKTKPPAKVKAPRKKAELKQPSEPAPTVVKPKASVSALQDAMRSAATVTSQTAEAKQLSEEEALLADPEWQEAIRAVEPLMHPTEKRRFAKILQAITPSERLANWKGRFGGKA